MHLFNYLFSASPGNDFRLGACEAPPSIISAYLGKWWSVMMLMMMDSDDDSDDDDDDDYDSDDYNNL